MKTNIVYNEDNIATLERFPSNSLDLIIASPPYDDMDMNFNPINKRGMRKYKGYSWDFKKIAEESYRTLKSGGVMVWVVNDPTKKGTESLASSLQKIYFRLVGFNIHDTMIYRQGGRGAHGSRYCYWQDFEYMLVLSKGKPKTMNFICDRENKTKPRISLEAQGHRHKDGRKKKRRVIERKKYGRRANVWTYHETGTQTKHPAVFPLELAMDHIKTWTNEGDVVYDPFGGRGTTAVACIKTNRNYILSEIAAEYIDIINTNIKNGDCIA
jgi:DNA modification methylase